MTVVSSPVNSRGWQTFDIDVKDGDDYESSDSEDEMDFADLQPEAISMRRPRTFYISAKNSKLAVR